MIAIQMNMFDKPKDELDLVWERIIELKDSHDKTRRRLFHELKEVRSKLVQVEAQNERIKINATYKARWTA